MTQKGTVLLLALALAISGALYFAQVEEQEVPVVNNLDTTCGFTDDFASFIKANGRYQFI